MRGPIRSLIENDGGAVAPTVALALFVLVGAGGLAFDYSRLVSMDTELQNAADQAALAAATQLDGDEGACGRAISAATTRAAAEAPWLANETRFANDSGGGLVLTVDADGTPGCTGHPNVHFWQDEDKALEATGDENANFVEVTIETRRANYALTPFVGALNSGDIAASAMAGMQSSFCRIPPLMMCNPVEDDDDEFNGDDYAGKGLLVKARGGGNAWAPGDFGFLAAGYDFSGGSGANVLRQVLGQENALIECVSGSRVTTEPGNMENVVDALNTRFDIYAQGGIANNQVCGSGQCPPDPNTRSDLVRGNGSRNNSNCRPEVYTNNQPSWTSNNTGWALPPPNMRYFAETSTSANLAPMGLPRDRCHASRPQTCGRMGNGTWDATSFFRTNYGWATAATWKAQTGLSDNATRYDVYKWQLTQTRAPRAITTLGNRYAHSRPICQTSPAATTERRKLTVAVVNCGGLSGRQTRRPVSWVDVLLLEPSWRREDAAGNVRTEASDIYVEVIGNATVVGAAGETSSVVRSVPYLVQ